MKNWLLLSFILLSTTLLAQIDIPAIDEIVKTNIEQHYFQGTVLVADQGEIVYQKTVGLLDREANILLNDQTRYGVASITKMITAILTLQLVEEGKLSLETSINEILPHLSIPKGHKITIHHLLLHISGLPNEASDIYSHPVSPENYVLETMKRKQKDIGFGKFNYANIDYVLLGLVIEKLRQQTWESVVQERIIQALHLEATGFLKKGKYPDNIAQTYMVSEEGQFEKDPEFYIENFYAAACMYSNASDLLKIDQALYGDQLLNDASKAKLYKSYPEYNYTGYSVWTYSYPFAETQPLVMERRGGILGSNSVLLRLLDRNQTIIILSNNNRFNPDSFGDKNNIREALLIELGKKSVLESEQDLGSHPD